jgi:hypothetical protein
MRRPPSLVVCFFAVLLTAAACGSGGGSSDNAATTTRPAATVAGSQAAPAATGDFCKDTGNQIQQVLGGSTADFGSLLTKLMDPSQKAAAAAQVDQIQQALDQSVKNAPTEIRSDMDTVAQSVRPLLDELKKANFDMSKVDLSAITSIANNPAITDAAQHISDYMKTKCGITIPGTTGS